MFSTSMLAAALAVVMNLANASPIREKAILERRQGIEKQSAPDYCQIIGNERGDLPYRYLDVSDDCKDAGLSNECCISVMHNGPIHPWTERDKNDLMTTIAQQSRKEGILDHTSYGPWLATFDTTLFTANDRVDSQILQVWFHTIKGLNLTETGGYGDIVLQIHGGTNDTSNYMRIKRLDY